MQNAELTGISWYTKQDKSPEPVSIKIASSCPVSYVCGNDDKK